MDHQNNLQFFAKSENNNVLSLFLNNWQTISLREWDGNLFVDKFLIKSLEMMRDNPIFFDSYCGLNIDWIGDQFISELKNFWNLKKGDRSSAVNSIFVMAYRFLCELEFMSPDSGSVRVRELVDAVDEKIPSLSENEKRQIIYARYLMPSHVVKRFLTNHAINDYRDFNLKVEKASAFIEGWDDWFELKKKK